MTDDAPLCCGRPMRAIGVAREDGVMLHSCSSCGRHAWSAHGRELDRAQLISMLRENPPGVQPGPPRTATPTASASSRPPHAPSGPSGVPVAPARPVSRSAASPRAGGPLRPAAAETAAQASRPAAETPRSAAGTPGSAAGAPRSAARSTSSRASAPGRPRRNPAPAPDADADRRTELQELLRGFTVHGSSS